MVDFVIYLCRCEQLKVPQNAVLSKLSLITPCELLSLPCVAQQQPGRSWQDPASSVTSAHAASRPTPGLIAGTTEDKRGQVRTIEDKRGQQHEGGADTGPAGARYSRWVTVTVDNIYTYFNKVRKQQHLRKLMGKLQCRVVLMHHNTDGDVMVACCSAVRARAEVLGVLGRLR